MIVTPAPVPERGSGWFAIALPPGAAGQWCRVAITLPSAALWWAKLLAEDQARGQVVREAFLGPRAGRHADTRHLLLHVPQFADRLLLHVITLAAQPAPTATLRILTRGHATWRLLAQGWRKLPACLRGHPAGLPGRIRTELGQAPARAGQTPGYDVWLELHDRWTGAARGLLLAQLATTPVPEIEILLLGTQTGSPPTFLAKQWLQPVRASLYQPGWRRRPDTWLVPLAPGEQLAPHALACFALAIARNPHARGLYADADRQTARGRQRPLFKPQADPWLLETGLLTAGACAFHPDAALPDADTPADFITLVMAQSMPPEAFVHVPFVLTHIPNAPRIAPPPAPHTAKPHTPMISILIPSACRDRHVVACLRRLLRVTEPGNFEILLAVSSIDAQDRRQRAVLTRLRRLPGIRILDLHMPHFNYAAVNNAAARHAEGELLLLLNDDVAPIRPDWLRRMASFTADAAADIVGVRLLYGNNRVQHAGVIMGLANLCEHAFRLTEREDAGPHGIARMTRRVSAVTAACMLVRRSLWQQLDGMDESFAIALNDVDFCLRAAQAGAVTVFAADVELHHYESLSLGRHYQGTRAGLEAVEVQRLRGKWQSVIAADPFYNHQASTEPGREFQPAFPPRLTPLSWIASEVPARG